MSKELTTKQFVLYQDNDQKVIIEVFAQNETIWLTQKKMAEFFDVGINTINYHLKEIFESKELSEDSTIRKIRIVQKEGGRDISREHIFYNLIAKNYLHEEHIRELNQIVSAYLDLAENRANRGIVMKMVDWAKFLTKFLELSNYPILQDKGKISNERAKLKAETEYKKFRVAQDKNFKSDFDEATRKYLKTST